MTNLELADIVRRQEAQQATGYPQQSLFDVETRVPVVSGLELVAADRTSGASKATLKWVRPQDPNIDHFEVWVNRTAYQSEQPTKVLETQDSPAAFTINADQDTNVVATVRTVMKNGLGSTLNASPTVTFQVFKFVATSDDIGAGAVGDTHLDRITTNAIKVRDADIDRLTANKVQIQDADIDRATVNKLVVKTADIDALAVTDAKIANLAVSKLLAGTIAVAVTLTAPNIQITGAHGGKSYFANLSSSEFYLVNNTDQIQASLWSAALEIQDVNSGHAVRPQVIYGLSTVYNAGSAYILLDPGDGVLAEPQLLFKNIAGTTTYTLDAGVGDVYVARDVSIDRDLTVTRNGLFYGDLTGSGTVYAGTMLVGAAGWITGNQLVSGDLTFGGNLISGTTAGLGGTVTYAYGVSPSFTTIQYQDWGGINRSLSVVTGVSALTASVTFTKGVRTA